MAQATGDRFEPVRMDELRTGDRIMQGHSVGRTIVIDGHSVDVTYEVTGPVGSDPTYPHFLTVDQIDPAVDDPGGFFAYDPATVMYRIPTEPDR